jgi:glyoxylase I family protein
MPGDVGRPQLVGVSHLGISVANIDRSLRFYCDVLGALLVRPPYSGDSRSFSGRIAVVGLGAHGLDLFEHAANSGERFEPARTGLDHIGLTAESNEELQAWASWLDARDVRRSPIREIENVGAMFDFVDPDGIQLEFIFVDLEKVARSAFAAGLPDRS